MCKINDLTGKTLGIWKIVKKANKRTPSGNVIYECKNIKRW